jgi:spermidine/putrescine transport system substrate-binding protein
MNEMAFHPRDRLPWNRHLSRREALKLLGGTVVAGGFLAGCSSGGSPSSASRLVIGTRHNPVKQPLFGDNKPIESGLEPEEGPLRLYNWADYINPSVLKGFTERFGAEVEVTTFYNTQEATQKLKTGKISFDVYFPTQDDLPKFVAGKILQPLNHDYLPNLKQNVWPVLADPFYDKGSRYSVPYVLYTTGIGWRTDMVPADIAGMDNPWEAFWDPEYKGIAGLYDEFRDALSTGMYKSGITDGVNGANPRHLEKAKNNLLELQDLVEIRYTIDGAYSRLPEGNLGLVQAWSGDTILATQYLPKGGDASVLRYVWPPKATQDRVGGMISNDNLTVLRNAEHPVLAHTFINYMLDEEVALENFRWLGYQPPQKSLVPGTLVAKGLIPENLATAVVEQEDFELGQVTKQQTPEQEDRWLEAWSQIKQGA